MYRYEDIQAVTQAFARDTEELTSRFIETLRQKGVSPEMLDQLCSSLQCNCFQ